MVCLRGAVFIRRVKRDAFHAGCNNNEVVFMQLSALQVNHTETPLGIGTRTPAFSWRFASPDGERFQIAYQIRVWPAAKEGHPVWDSGRVESGNSSGIAYGGRPLVSAARYVWQVTVWDAAGGDTVSDPAWFEMGLLSPEDWSAQWIRLPQEQEEGAAAPHYRKESRLSRPVAAARLYITALGLYEARINGHPVSDALLTPVGRPMN